MEGYLTVVTFDHAIDAVEKLLILASHVHSILAIAVQRADMIPYP
jgi:hypothetical protein